MRTKRIYLFIEAFQKLCEEEKKVKEKLYQMLSSFAREIYQRNLISVS